VVVPVYNGVKTLPECLVALQKQTLAARRYEVVVVDDGSTDGSADAASRFDVRVVRRKHRGAAAARNAGIAATRGDVVLFTDADCAPAPDWIEQMIAPLADGVTVGVKGVYRTRQAGLVSRFVQLEYQDKYDRMVARDGIDFIDTYSAAYRRSVLLQEGGFDESFPGAAVEDIDLSFRLAKRGHRMAFNPRAIVYHHHPTALLHYVRRKVRYGYWRVPVYARYPTKLKGDSHTPTVIKLQLGLVGLMAVLTPMALVIPALRVVWLGLAAASCLSTLPFCVKALRRDAPVALAAPFLLWMRALALGLGLVCGMIHYAQARLAGCVVGAHQFDSSGG
jgi:glycosyltransferase involved in cell wall biosynthesis